MTGPPIWQARTFSRNESAIETAIAALDPDKYLGTLGTIADAPKGATKPHHTAFPAANAGGWLRVVSDTRIGDLEIVDKEEWICLVDGTSIGKPKNWERCQTGEKKLQYPIYDDCIGFFARYAIPEVLPHNVKKSIRWTNDFARGAFEKPYRDDLYKDPIIIDLYDFVRNKIEFDLLVNFEFAPDIVGDRYIRLIMGTYYPGVDEGPPEKYNKYQTLLEEFIVKNKSVPASRIGYTNAEMFRTRITFSILEPFDETPYTYGLWAEVQQDSGGDLELVFGEIKLVAYQRRSLA